MTEVAVKTQADFVLPSSVVTKIDVSRLVAEVERVDNELTAASVRSKTGSAEQPRPTVSEQLADFLQQNQITLENSNQSTELVKQLRILKDSVPVIHMTFAVTADIESLQQLTAWVRSSINPRAVLAIGLQPALVAGVYLRTPNHIHDLSLRATVDSHHDVLVQELESLRVSK